MLLVYRTWDRIRDRHQIETYVRKVMLNEHRSAWRTRSRRREVITEAPPEQPTPPAEYDGSGDLLWDFVRQPSHWPWFRGGP